MLSNNKSFNVSGSAKSVIVYGLLALALIAGAFFMNSQKAEAADFTSCYDVAGEGMEVPFGGVPNSGKPMFDDVAVGAPAFAYQACLEDEGTYSNDSDVAFGAPGTPYYQVKGWLWNDNLGWISMYCEGGSNLGEACGAEDYGVTIDDAGNLHGYAWGDNTGWISFDNGGFSNVKIDISQPECQGYVYGPTKPYAACPNHTKMDTMAWSDNVGWIDFDGVIFPWYQVVEALTDANVVVELLPDPDILDKYTPGSEPPYADGSDVYKLKVTILDDDGDPVESPRYTTEISFIWTKDTVKYDQIVTGTILDDPILPTCAPLPPRATTKPCAFTEAANYTSGTGVWEGDITSLAPTSDMNANQDGFSYETFVLPTTKPGGSLESNDLIIKSAQISVYDNDVGLCAYGDDIATCSKRSRGFNIPEQNNVVLSFMPQTELTTLTDPDGNDYIDISVGNPETFPAAGRMAHGASIELHAGFETSIGGLEFVFDNGDGTIEYGVDSSDVTIGSIVNLVMGVAQQEGVEVEQIVSGLYLYSVVTEGSGANEVKYYSNKLPRVTGSTAIQPVAILRGSVYSTGATTTTKTSGTIRSLGEISTNLVRDQVFRNVSSLIAGADTPSPGTVNIVSDSGGFKKNSGSGTLIPLLNDSSNIPQVYYARGDVHIGSGGTVSWTGERTIVTIGGNIYIDANLYNSGVNPKPKLGLIALRDYSENNQGGKGHIYIKNDVNAIQANMFADGSVFRYKSGDSMRPDGRPEYTNEGDYEAMAKTHQLYIEGSVASQNTVGGTNQKPWIDGLGKETDDLVKAQQYDLNYLSEYVGMINRDPTTNQPLDANGDPIVSDAALDACIIHPSTEVPWSVYEDSGGKKGCVWPPYEADSTGGYVSAQTVVGSSVIDEEVDLGSTYIFFDPPSASLPGFTAGSQFDITVRPQ